MTSAEFIRAFDKLGVTKWTEVAKLIKRSHVTVSQYANGRVPIPQEIADRVGAMLANPNDPAISIGIIQSQAPKRTMRHRLKPLPSAPFELPPYLMKHSQYVLVIKALRLWRDECEHRAKFHRSTEAKAELDALALLLPRLPITLPYVVRIYEHEWPVVSRALLYAARSGYLPKARHFYQTWRKNRYVGSLQKPPVQSGDHDAHA